MITDTKVPFETGPLRGKGSFAHVYAHPHEAHCVIKRTACSISIAMLRRLLEAGPQPGLPVVLEELWEEDFGAVWFRIEQLHPVPERHPLLETVNAALGAAYEKTSNADFVAESELAAKFAVELKKRKQRRLGDGALWLSRFLEEAKGGLDLHVRSNYMMDKRGRLVFSDPVSLY